MIGRATPQGAGRRRSIGAALLATGAAAIVPGLGQVLQRRWRVAAAFGVPTVALAVGAVWLAGRDPLTLVDWTLDAEVLRGLAMLGIAWAVVCAASALDAARAGWPTAHDRRWLRTTGSLVIVVAAVGATLPGLAGAWVALRQDTLLDRVFATEGQSTVARPSSLEALGITTVPPLPSSTTVVRPTTTVSPATSTTLAPTTTSTTLAPTTTMAPLPAGRWNIALLGGDAGPRRWGLRTDTMIVVSIDRQTGDLASVSIPRNLRRLPLPAGPLRDRFPGGFEDLANALYPYVMTRPALGLDPAHAVKGALAELLGIPIDHYVLVDMTGFVAIIDALGGVTVNLSRRIEMIPNMDRREPVPYIGPGAVTMDGTMALSFVRTREQDSDYGRMKRQRCLLGAVARSASPSTLALHYLELVTAVEAAFQSDIPREALGDLVRLFAKVDVDRSRTLVLVPPVIQPGRPDVARIRGLVAGLLDAAAPPIDPSVSAPTC